jgi:O-antigen ligase
MKEIFCTNDTPANKISYYHMLAFLCALPFDQFYSELILVSLLVHTLIHLTKEKLFSVRTDYMLPALLYIPVIICTFYSTDKNQAFKDWEKQLALLLFPLIFSVSGIDFKRYTIPLLKGFGLSCIAVIIYFFADALITIRYYKFPVKSLFSIAFTNHNFSAPFDLHATYFSMYCGVSLVAFIYLLIYSTKKYQQFFYITGCCILLAGLIQLSSRSVLIALFFIINFLMPFFLLNGSIRKKFIIISCSLSVLIICSFAKIGSFKNRFVYSLKQDLTIDKNIPQNILESRATRWHAAFELIGQSPLKGYGTGSEVNVLQQKYFEEHLNNSYLHQLNAHNEYLSLMLKFGVAGVLLYLFVLYAGFKNAILQKDIFFCSFLVLTAVVSFSENILDVNKGIFFFSFFFSLFLNTSAKRDVLVMGYEL